MDEHSEFYDKIWPHLTHHPDALINPVNAADVPEVSLSAQVTTPPEAQSRGFQKALIGDELTQSRPRFQWSRESTGLHGNEVAQYQPVPIPVVIAVSREQEIEEESRRETVKDMLQHPRQRAFMERVMPIEWCHKRYPEVYAQ